MQKKCSRCKTRKPIAEFNKRADSSDGHNSQCKTCTRSHTREHYSDNKKYYIQKAKRRDAVVGKANRIKVWRYLQTHHCVDCDEDDLRCLQFDHVRGQKKYEISRMYTHAWKSIENEIKKCVVRCANCHAKKTANEFGYMVTEFMTKGIKKI